MKSILITNDLIQARIKERLEALAKAKAEGVKTKCTNEEKATQLVEHVNKHNCLLKCRVDNFTDDTKMYVWLNKITGKEPAMPYVINWYIKISKLLILYLNTYTKIII